MQSSRQYLILPFLLKIDISPVRVLTNDHHWTSETQHFWKVMELSLGQSATHCHYRHINKEGHKVLQLSKGCAELSAPVMIASSHLIFFLSSVVYPNSQTEGLLMTKMFLPDTVFTRFNQSEKTVLFLSVEKFW